MKFADWNTIITVTVLGDWGHDAYQKEYRFSGAMRHYPETIYRFTRCGEASVATDGYMDIEVPMKDLAAGYKNSNFRIDSIAKADLAERKE